MLILVISSTSMIFNVSSIIIPQDNQEIQEIQFNTAATESFYDAQNITNSPNDVELNPLIAVDGSNIIHLVWEIYFNATYSEIQYANSST